MLVLHRAGYVCILLLGYGNGKARTGVLDKPWLARVDKTARPDLIIMPKNLLNFMNIVTEMIAIILLLVEISGRLHFVKFFVHASCVHLAMQRSHSQIPFSIFQYCMLKTGRRAALKA